MGRADRSTPRRIVSLSACAALCVSMAGGCTTLSPQLPSTDFAQLEQLETREAREVAYERNRVRVHREMNGMRFTKGEDPNAAKRDWQSLDTVLRSDRNSAAALPDKKRRLVRVFTGLTAVSLIAATAGVAGTAREGLDTSQLSGSSAVLLFGSVLSVGFAITAGVLYGQMRRDYIKAVDVYNDSLGLRLGLYDPDGKYIPPAGTLIDDEGFVILSDDEAAMTAPTPVPQPQPEGPAPAQTEPVPEAGEGEPPVMTAPVEDPTPTSEGAPVEPAEPTAPIVPAAPEEGAKPDVQKPAVQSPGTGGGSSAAPRGLSLGSR